MTDLNEHQIQDVTAEILEHMMAPKTMDKWKIQLVQEWVLIQILVNLH